MKHIAVITKKPELSGRKSTPDGAINGNGDLGIILGNCDGGLRIYISKCDLWQGIEAHDRGGLKPLGYIDVEIPEALYNNYHVEQDMDSGELHCIFRDGDKNCEFYIRTCKAENSIMLESVGNVEISPVLKVYEGETSGEKGALTENGCKGIYRIFRGDDHVFETHAYAFIRKVGNGKYYTFVSTNHDTPDPKKLALSKVSEITEKEYDRLKEKHYAAWKSFWSKSAFICGDRELELGWYASQYFMAGCAGNEKFPPGLFANFITVENPSWHSDYHMNYNYQAPFYAACSSNHVEFTDCYHAPLEEITEKAKGFAKRFGCGGIMVPVGVMPKGICSEVTPYVKYPFERLFLGQKSNAIHPADILVFRWKATRDKEYARKHAYPYIKNCLEFFEDYMIFKDGRYWIKRDAAHEVPYYKTDFSVKKYSRYINDTNNALTLGMLRMCIPTAIDMAKELGIDGDKQKKWQDILDKLSPFPTYYRYGKKVFRYTEKGQAWNDGNDVGLQHIYPACCVGLSSDEELLKIARNTFEMKARSCWNDENAVCSFYPMAAHLGKDPCVIIRNLKKLIKKRSLPNMLFDFAGGCLENCSVFANTLNEMVMQSYEGIIRIFPDWDENTDCRFENLRADGAFLVSAEMKNGTLQYVEIECEIGGTLRIQNPFPKAKVSRDGKIYETSESEIVLETGKGSKIRITA